MLQFDAKTRKVLDHSYRGADIVKRRMASFTALDPRPGERILDLGCGLGLLTAEIARAVGDSGFVYGIDPSEDMRNGAIEICEDFNNVRISDGAADNLALEDTSIDKVVSLQVFEYLSDIPAALNELNRVLFPGGIVVIGDMHWDSIVWHSESPQRMRNMLDAWDKHVTERCVPALLPNLLRESGFKHLATHPLTVTDTCLKPDGLAHMLFHLMTAYAVQNDLLPEATAADWAEEQNALAAEGRFFFSLTHFVTVGAKTGDGAA